MKTLHFFLLMLFVTVIGGSMNAQDQRELAQLMRERGEYYFTLNVKNQSEIKELCQLCSVDKTDGKTVVCYANQGEYDYLLKMGYQPTLETPPSLREEAKMWDGNRATYDWNSYPTYSQLEEMIQGFSSSTVSGRTCTYLELGTLSSGRKIMGVRINNGSAEGKPKFLYSSTIHGDETTGMILLLRLIDELCTSTDSRIVRLVDSLDIFIFPDANPDGTYYGGNNTVTGSRRANGNGVDMNRNYPDPHSSQHPDGNAWQSETQWFMQLAEDYPFVMAANFHGGAEVMNYPWDNTSTRHADDAWWQYISREYVTNTRTVYSSYMTDTYSSGITNGADWYMIGGGRQDYMNGYRQCREITIECSSDKTLAASQLNTYWNYNHTAMLAFMEQCLNGVHGKVVDATTNQVLDGVTVTVLNHDDEYSIVSTHEDGYYHRPIKGGSYSFKFTKDGYCSQTLDVVINDDQKVDLDVFLYPAGDCPVVLDCYNPATNIAAGCSYIMGHLDGTNLITPSHNSSSTVTTTTTEVTTTDNGFSVEEETNIPQVTLTAYGNNGQYYIYYNGRYLARNSNGSGLTWGTSQSSYGRWYINSNGIYVAVSSGGGWGGGSSTTNYYLYYNNGSFRLSTTSQNNITFYTEGDCPVTEHTIAATAEPFEGGTVTGAGTYDDGATCTLVATSNPTYSFVSWTENDEEVSTESTYSFTVTSDRTLVAQFMMNTYSITATAEPYEGGSVTGSGTYMEGETCTLRATPRDDYSFVSFTIGDETITDNPYSFTVNSTLTVIANFQLNSYEVTVTANPAEGGTVAGAGTYNHGETATLTATVNSGYEFVNWTIDGVEVGTDIEYFFTVTEPVEIVANFELSTDSQEFSLATGWSWWSTYIEMNGINGLQLLEEALGDNATQIKSQNRFLLYENNLWDGNLTAIANEQMYRLYTVTDGEYAIAGSYADPAEHTVTLRQGWNWIGYVENTVMEPNTALANLTTASENDCLKSYTDFATYYEGYGWYGDLETMEPGLGYMLRAANAGSFTYASSDKGSVVNSNHSNVNSYWKPVIGKFPNNMNVLAVVELNGNELRTENVELAAFDENGECRGSALLSYVEPIDRYVAFLTVYGENEDALHFRVRYQDAFCAVNEQLIMMADEVIGKGTEPYKMTIKGAGFNEISDNLSLYPNPVGQGQEVRIALPENMGNATVEIIDVMGRTICRNIVEGKDGACTVATPDASGVYTIRVIDEQGQTWNGKLIIK